MTGQRAISADSHISEVEDCFRQIDSKFESRRPQQMFDEKRGAVLEIADLGVKIPMGLICTAGREPQDFGKPVRWEELHPAGYDPKERLKIQDEEGIVAEVLYPSLGMVLCNHPDSEFRAACFAAYNRWLAEFCAHDPQRLIGMPLLGMQSPADAIAELEEAKRQGFRGLMLPGHPVVEDYDHPSYDDFWRACVDANLPASFHILTTRDGIMERVRGSKLVHQIVTVRGVQNIILMLILGGVFDRHPKLKVVCAESDGGWVPHFRFRMDHAYERHRFHLPTEQLQKMPSSYFDDNIYVTFQDDYSIKHITGGLNLKRVMWASDFPHSDGTYPRSREVMDCVTQGMSANSKADILYNNAADLYGINWGQFT